MSLLLTPPARAHLRAHLRARLPRRLSAHLSARLRHDPARDAPGPLVGRRLTVLVAYGDFGHAVVDGWMWTIRHTEIMHPGDTVYVIEQRSDLLVVASSPAPDDDATGLLGRLHQALLP